MPVSILRKGSIKYFSINNDQHKNFYNVFEEQIVDDFLNSVYGIFNPNEQYKIEGYAEIINQQLGEFIVAESNRVWLTNTLTDKYFSEYVWSSIKSEILKRVIVNGQTGSSWHFKRFSRLTIIFSTVKEVDRLISNYNTCFFFSNKKMDFLSLEAHDISSLFQFSDDEEEKETDDLDDFVNNEQIDEECVSFYRERNHLDINDYPKFVGQVRNSIEAINSANEIYFSEDKQPELFAPENRDNVTFDRFQGFGKSDKTFKKTLRFEIFKKTLQTLKIICFTLLFMV